MWQDIVNELEKTARTAGNHFWPDVDWKEEGRMLRQLWTAVLAGNALTAGQIEAFLGHVSCISSFTPCRDGAESVCFSTLRDLSRELLFIDRKVNSICFKLFGRPFLTEHVKNSIAAFLDVADPVCIQ